MAAWFRRQRLLSHARLDRLDEKYKSASREMVAGFRHRRLVLDACLERLEETRRAASSEMAAGFRRQRLLLSAPLERAREACRSALAGLLAGLRNQRLLLHVRLERLGEACRSAYRDLVAESRRQRVLLDTRLEVARGTWKSALAGLLAELRRQRQLSRAHLVRVAQAGRKALAGLAWELRQQRLRLLWRLDRVTETFASSCRNVTAELRGRRQLLHARLVRYRSRARAVGGRVVVPRRVTSSTAELKPAQRRALLGLESGPAAFLTRSKYERLTGVGRSQAASDLSELVAAGLLVRVGSGPTTRYVLAHQPAAQRRWTRGRIRLELETFCAGRSFWPTATEFKAAGRGDLYVAASRYGGIAFWASELGLERAERPLTTGTPTRAPLRSRLAWAFAGGLAGLVIAAATATAVVTMHGFGSGGKPRASAPATTPPTGGLVEGLLPPLRSAPARHVAPSRDHVTKPTVRPKPRPRTSPTQHATLVSNVQNVSARTAPAATTPQTDGPAPLPAPPTAAPSPLKAP